jgi:OFA family oxalate/formate antiporter-like MFS transporter
MIDQEGGRMEMTQVEGSVRQRGWYHGWNIVAVCILSQVAANGLTYNAYSLFLRDWSEELHAPISRLQLPIAGMALVAALLSPMVGVLADKYPARRLFGWGLLGMAIFYVAISAVTAPWQIAALYAALAPLALCLSTAVTANALISRWFVRRLGLALGLSAFGIGMAGVLLPPLIAATLPTVGWRMIWRGGGLVVAVLVLPLVVAIARNRPAGSEGNYYLSGDGKPAGHHAHGAGASQVGWREVAARKNFWLLVAIYLPMMALYGGCAQNLGPYAASHGLSQQSAGALLSVLSFSHVIATLVLGLVSDRFGNRLPFAGLAVVMVTGAIVLAFGSGLPVLAVGCALVGFGGGLFTLLAAAIAVEFGGHAVGRAFGLCMLFIPLTALAPFAIAKTQESTGSYAPAILGLAALVLISGALSLLLREKGRGGQPANPALSQT